MHRAAGYGAQGRSPTARVVGAVLCWHVEVAPLPLGHHGCHRLRGLVGVLHGDHQSEVWPDSSAHLGEGFRVRVRAGTKAGVAAGVRVGLGFAPLLGAPQPRWT